MCGKIHLEEVNPENWRPELKVREDQREFVSEPNRILARAYAYRNQGSKAYVIYHNQTPVGMSLQYDCDDFYDFSQLLIDERYQGRGFGFEAGKQVNVSRETRKENQNKDLKV